MWGAETRERLLGASRSQSGGWPEGPQLGTEELTASGVACGPVLSKFLC